MMVRLRQIASLNIGVQPFNWGFGRHPSPYHLGWVVGPLSVTVRTIEDLDETT